MGFIIIIPFGALAGWSIFAIYRWLRRGNFDRTWWKAFVTLSVIGTALGLYFIFVAQYKVANARLEGFPIPIGISNRQTPNDPWVKSAMPEPVRIGGAIADLLVGVALCLAPIAIAAFLKENKGKKFIDIPPANPPS